MAAISNYYVGQPLQATQAQLATDGPLISGAGQLSSNQSWTGANTFTGPMIINGALTVGGNATFTGGVSSQGNTPFSVANSAVVLSGGNSAQILSINSAGGADAKAWDMYVDTVNHLNFRAINDADNNASTWLIVTRSGFAISDINFGAGLTVGAPTGGNKGAGTINCTGLFVNGVAVTVP